MLGVLVFLAIIGFLAILSIVGICGIIYVSMKQLIRVTRRSSDESHPK